MVAFHFLKFKMLFANGAYSVLSAICCQFVPFIEYPQI